MVIVETYELLSQEDGEFVGAFEIVEGRHMGELWDADGDFHKYVRVEGLYGDALFKHVLNEFAACKNCPPDSVYLTDNGQNEILMAL